MRRQTHGDRDRQAEDELTRGADQADRDGDGSVPRDVFIAYAVEQFDEADANGDGALAAPEFRAMHGRP